MQPAYSQQIKLLLFANYNEVDSREDQFLIEIKKLDSCILYPEAVELLQTKREFRKRAWNRFKREKYYLSNKIIKQMEVIIKQYKVIE